MTKPATNIEYVTIPVATVVGGTWKLFTMPPNATGREATLKDISTWPSAMAIIGIQDACDVSAARAADLDGAAILSLLIRPAKRFCGEVQTDTLNLRAATQTNPFPASAIRIWQ